MKIIVAEKPSVGATIADVVGATCKKKGYFEGNDYIVTWAVGHLIGLYEPNDYKEEWKKWSLDALPIIPSKWETKILANTADQFHIIEKLFARQDISMIINAGDAGQEGELIQRHIYNKALKRKIPIKRLWISSMTVEAIENGLNNLRDSSEFDNLYYAGLARAMSDWLIGMNGSRLFTCIFLTNPPLSVGRVQSPTLSEIVTRHLFIVNFKPEDYFTLHINSAGIDASWFAKEGNKKSFPTFEEAASIENKVKGKTATVVMYKTEQKTEARPQLHSLPSLQQEASRIYKYSAAETQAAAQSLYEKKLSTYPRTDSNYITTDMVPEMQKIMDSLNQNQTYSAMAQYVLKNGLNIDSRIVNNTKVEDHTALLPTTNIAKMELSQLSKKELDIYHLIISRFILSMCNDYIYSQSTVVFEVESETFKATGRIPLKKGYRALQEILFPQKEEKEGKTTEKDNPLKKAVSDLAEGKTYPVENTEIKKKQTTPPQEYTDGTLIKKMEAPFSSVEMEGDEKEIKESLSGRGLGTPATRANIIEELVRKGYVFREKNSLVPTERGIKMVMDVLPDELKKTDMTAEWEYKLHQIARGAYNPQQFVNEVKQMVCNLIEIEKGKNRTVSFGKNDESQQIGSCPLCGGAVYRRKFTRDGIKQSIYSCENYKKENRTCSFILWSNDRFVQKITGKELKETSVKTILKNKRFKTTGKKKDGSGTYQCYIILESWKDGRPNWKLEFLNKNN